MPNITKTGGGKVRSKGGGFAGSVQQTFDPENWLVTLFRVLKTYVTQHLDDRLYDVRFSFPTANDLGQMLPFSKTLIHFEIDDIDNVRLGFGQNIVDWDYDDIGFEIREYEAKQHMVNFDVGIWTSERAGGVTARLIAYQLLNNLFFGANEFEIVRERVGIEIISFEGAQFIKEEIDDIDVFRVANMTLIVRVFSKHQTTNPYIVGELQDPALRISDEVIVDVP